ncbi:MAG: histidine phosphatase family protein [Thiotrichaceae bacterium]|nr:histidine phosphatase family protein [Thiotrichaceae bacterium]
MDKELFLMRHAKSAWDSDASDDFSRPLSKRGINAAQRIGDGLKRLNWIPELVLSSPSARTQQTLELIELKTEIKLIDAIYDARVNDLFKLLDEIPESISKVMLLGHNPAFEELLLHLAPNAERQKNGKLMTTANVVRLGINGKWQGLKKRQASLLGHIRPKEI